MGFQDLDHKIFLVDGVVQDGKLLVASALHCSHNTSEAHLQQVNGVLELSLLFLELLELGSEVDVAVGGFSETSGQVGNLGGQQVFVFHSLLQLRFQDSNIGLGVRPVNLDLGEFGISSDDLHVPFVLLLLHGINRFLKLGFGGSKSGLDSLEFLLESVNGGGQLGLFDLEFTLTLLVAVIGLEQQGIGFLSGSDSGGLTFFEFGFTVLDLLLKLGNLGSQETFGVGSASHLGFQRQDLLGHDVGGGEDLGDFLILFANLGFEFCLLFFVLGRHLAESGLVDLESILQLSGVLFLLFRYNSFTSESDGSDVVVGSTLFQGSDVKLTVRRVAVLG
mmetsp:Transcript_7091/g.14632  ORF Transcript_7091/g.14632 Transcript_7091/m.14632 type:complete len:334 (+) Transcript_7091:659-1660(+)